MTPREERRIADYLSLSLEDFRRRYETDRWRFCSIAEGAGGRCVMHGADNRCSIYPCRPISCRTWPFWPELLESSDAWNAAARKCPGMGQGTWWEGWRIEAVLKAHISHKQSLSGAAEAGKGGR